MAEKLGKWASNRGLISKIRPSDGCKGDTVPSTVVRGYDLRKPGGHLGNVGSTLSGSTEGDEHSLFFICLEFYENINGTLLQLQPLR